MVYQWKYNSMPVKAQAAGEFLEDVEREYGTVTPEVILERSREDSAPLHPCFEWDDNIAAEKYRLKQAGYLIRNLTVVVEKRDTVPQAVRAYVNISPEKKGAFVAVNTALQDTGFRAQVLRNALNELSAFQKKYAELEELARIFKTIDEVRKEKVSA